MSHHDSKVTVTLVLKNVPVHTGSHPEDITVANWKHILQASVEAYIKENGLAPVDAIRDYKITGTEYHQED